MWWLRSFWANLAVWVSMENEVWNWFHGESQGVWDSWTGINLFCPGQRVSAVDYSGSNSQEKGVPTSTWIFLLCLVRRIDTLILIFFQTEHLETLPALNAQWQRKRLFSQNFCVFTASGLRRLPLVYHNQCGVEIFWEDFCRDWATGVIPEP